tara:strand:- start:3441 stop:3920 length:480 start_codon:yes stop_codon:yes gene_type:complete
MHFKRNNKESKSYVQGLRSFGNTLPRGVKGILKKNGYNYSEIISRWNAFAGAEIANYCYPKSIKMTNGDKNGTLILAVKRGNEINIEYSKRNIINRVNSYFGYQLISEVRLETFSLTSKERNKKKRQIALSKNFDKKVNEISNKGIRNSLMKLLEAVKK